ncbi:MAG: NAD(P)H-dependent glycerol-3-phosphate dehydrogenase [bacterium JZ-2024 1]
MKYGVIGGGTWATTLSIVLSNAGGEVVWWFRRPDRAEAVRIHRINRPYLPDIRIPDAIAITADLTELRHSEGIFVAVPSPFFEETLQQVSSGGLSPEWLVSGVKGLIPHPNGDRPLLQSEVAPRYLPRETRFAVLTGPNIARNILRSEPTTAVVGGEDEEALIQVQEAFRGSPIRVYRTDDIAGIQVAGAFKNIIAIAAGIVQGMNLGSNTLGALMVRGLFEMGVVGRLYSARPASFWGSAGLGDLIATSFSPNSRNAALGRAIATGKSLETALAESPRVAEGLFATRLFFDLARRAGLDLPITTAVYRILFENLSPQQALEELMARPLRKEELEMTPDETALYTTPPSGK